MLQKLSPRGFRSFFRLTTFAQVRGFVRGEEVGLVLAGIVIGILSGFAVTAMSFASHQMHSWFFGANDIDRLSPSPSNGKFRFFIAPIVGGMLLGTLLFVLAMTRKKPMVDPIEANALHGGRMSLTDSIVVGVQNLISNGFGASVGLEAGYTQIAAGIASKLGLQLQLRRADLRILVGCGAAGAIAAAFNAPLTGAFYAFELIIGTYTILSLTPVVVSALVSTLVARMLYSGNVTIDVGSFGSVATADYLPALLLGCICAGFGILIMQGVALVEEVARKSSVAPPLRPILGGIVVGLLAMISPQVLSAGHAALHLNLATDAAMQTLAFVLILKAIASAVSIGSGFRGGLFFASLFMGALVGKLFAHSAPYFDHATLTPVIYAIVGMSSLAVAVIGGPLTMTFLSLEITGDFAITALVLAAVITSSLVVRSTFGYSFATWRFHLRGESIRSAHDIGWIRGLTVAKMMREDVRTARASLTLDEFRRDFPLGSAQRVVLVDGDDRYAGLIVVADVYAFSLEEADDKQGLGAFVSHRNDVLLPQMNAKQAAAIFEATKSEVLAVVNDPSDRKVVGRLSEGYTLRRYSEELDRQRREISGEL